MLGRRATFKDRKSIFHIRNILIEPLNIRVGACCLLSETKKVDKSDTRTHRTWNI